MSDLVRIKQPHDQTAHDYHEWVTLGERLTLDSMGRPNARMWSGPTWTKWICNNTQCTAWAIVHDQLVQTAIEREADR